MTSSDSKVDVQHLCKLAGLSARELLPRLRVRAPREADDRTDEPYPAAQPALSRFYEATRRINVDSGGAGGRCKRQARPAAYARRPAITRMRRKPVCANPLRTAATFLIVPNLLRGPGAVGPGSDLGGGHHLCSNARVIRLSRPSSSMASRARWSAGRWLRIWMPRSPWKRLITPCSPNESQAGQSRPSCPSRRAVRIDRVPPAPRQVTTLPSA